MRHPYVGDVGDFGKYGLLRAIHNGADGDVLGVVWYLTDSTEHNNDGKHDGYLERTQESFRACDPALFDKMKKIRQQRILDLKLIEQGKILPSNTVFYGKAVPCFHGRASDGDSQEARWAERDLWHANALRAVVGAKCVFTDPDNGIIFGDRNEFLPSSTVAFSGATQT